VAKRRPSRRPSLVPLPSLTEPPQPIRLVNLSAMRSEWRDPAETMPSTTRTVKTVTGYRGFDPLRRCFQRHGDRCDITERHIVAADILRRLADGAAIGFSGERDLSVPITSITYRPVTGPAPLALKQAKCWAGFVRAMAIFTRDQRALLTWVVLLNRTVDRWCKEKRAAGEIVFAAYLMGRLTACLDLLEQHFASEVDQAIKRGRVA
jgi:hypothetical protein